MLNRVKIIFEKANPEIFIFRGIRLGMAFSGHFFGHKILIGQAILTSLWIG